MLSIVVVENSRVETSTKDLIRITQPESGHNQAPSKIVDVRTASMRSAITDY